MLGRQIQGKMDMRMPAMAFGPSEVIAAGVFGLTDCSKRCPTFAASQARPGTPQAIPKFSQVIMPGVAHGQSDEMSSPARCHEFSHLRPKSLGTSSCDARGTDRAGPGRIASSNTEQTRFRVFAANGIGFTAIDNQPSPSIVRVFATNRQATKAAASYRIVQVSHERPVTSPQLPCGPTTVLGVARSLDG